MMADAPKVNFGALKKVPPWGWVVIGGLALFVVIRMRQSKAAAATAASDASSGDGSRDDGTDNTDTSSDTADDGYGGYGDGNVDPYASYDSGYSDPYLSDPYAYDTSGAGSTYGGGEYSTGAQPVVYETLPSGSGSSQPTDISGTSAGTSVPGSSGTTLTGTDAASANNSLGTGGGAPSRPATAHTAPKKKTTTRRPTVTGSKAQPTTHKPGTHPAPRPGTSRSRKKTTKAPVKHPA